MTGKIKLLWKFACTGTTTVEFLALGMGKTKHAKTAWLRTVQDNQKGNRQPNGSQKARVPLKYLIL